MKKITKMFVALAIMLSITTIDVFASDTTIAGLYLYDDEDKGGIDEGYYWDSSELTLTVYDLKIDANGYNSLVLPGGSTIDLVGDLSIRASQYAINIKGDLLITGSGNLSVIAFDGVDYSMDALHTTGDLTINTTGDVNIYGYFYQAIYVEGDLSIECANLTCESGEDSAIQVDKDIYINVSEDLFVKSSTDYYSGIISRGNIEIIVDGDMTIESSGLNSYGIYSEGDIKLTINGNSTITSDDYGVRIDNGALTISGIGELCISGYEGSIASDTLTLNDTVTVSTKGYIWVDLDELVISENATLNTLVANASADLETYVDVIYGDFVPCAETVFYSGVLSFSKGSTLTIPSGMNADLSGYEIDFTNAVIIVEDGGSVYFGVDYDYIYSAVIDSFNIDDIYVGDTIVYNTTVSIIDNDYMLVEDENVVYGEITYTYSTSEDGVYTSDVPTTAGIYYVKATIATYVGEGYVTTSTIAITNFEIKAIEVSDDTEEDTDVNDDKDTDVDADVDTDTDDTTVDTSDATNIAGFTMMSLLSLLGIVIFRRRQLVK